MPLACTVPMVRTRQNSGCMATLATLAPEPATSRYARARATLRTVPHVPRCPVPQSEGRPSLPPCHPAHRSLRRAHPGMPNPAPCYQGAPLPYSVRCLTSTILKIPCAHEPATYPHLRVSGRKKMHLHATQECRTKTKNPCQVPPGRLPAPCLPRAHRPAPTKALQPNRIRVGRFCRGRYC